MVRGGNLLSYRCQILSKALEASEGNFRFCFEGRLRMECLIIAFQSLPRQKSNLGMEKGTLFATETLRPTPGPSFRLGWSEGGRANGA